MSERYDDEVKLTAKAAIGAGGRHVIAVIGIDRYQHWPSLSNAVRDATGAAALFGRLGFEEITARLLDDRATGKAIQSLVTDDLMALGPDDNLVLFYAGHGGTRKHCLGDEVIKTGYLIPFDASRSLDKVATWLRLDAWLHAVSLLPARHILVVLDACHSGIALDPIIKWRDIGSWQDAPLATLQARRSRRIITSALDDQVALDSGPVHGHSLFTGCLLEGLTGGIRGDRRAVTTGSELGLYVQRRVQTYPGARQTPDFGTFAFDDRGEMVIPLVVEPAIERREAPATTASSSAWIDLIDLDDTPELVSDVEARLDNAASGAGVDDRPSAAAGATPPPPAASGDAAELVSGARLGATVFGAAAEDVEADLPGFAALVPTQVPGLLPTVGPAPSPPPQTPMSLPGAVAPIAPAPGPAEPGAAELGPPPPPAVSPAASSTSSPLLSKEIAAPTGPAPAPPSMADPSPSPLPAAPSRDHAASIASPAVLAKAASAQPVPAPTARPRRSKRSTPILPPLPPPTETVAPAVPTPDGRRWIVIGAMGALTLAVVLIGYLIFGHESSPVDPSARVAASNPPDAPHVDAGSGVALDAPPDAPLQSARAPVGGCPTGMVPVAAGTFHMGSPDGTGDTDEHPQHEVTLSAYYRLAHS